MEQLLARSPRPAVATHDLNLVDKAAAIIRRDGIRAAEIQFFRGVRDELAGRLRANGFNVRVYIPYGSITRYVASSLGNMDLRRQAQRVLGLRPRP